MTREHQTFIIDDDRDRGRSLAALLERAGFACRVFSSTLEFLLDLFPKEGCVIAGLGVRVTAKDAREQLAVLTPRELSVLMEVAKGSPNKIAAQKLGISPRTVEVHRARIMVKLRADSLSHLIRLVIAAGL